MTGYMANIIKKVAAAVLLQLQRQHGSFLAADPLMLERFVLKVFQSAPSHIRWVLCVLSLYLQLLGWLLYFRPFGALSLKQVGALVQLMDASPLGAVRAYARFFSNLVILGALEERTDAS
jgi:hypothetical protein